MKIRYYFYKESLFCDVLDAAVNTCVAPKLRSVSQ
jgi:hypothetical protein